jgi:hypothetical protein
VPDLGNGIEFELIGSAPAILDMSEIGPQRFDLFLMSVRRPLPKDSPGYCRFPFVTRPEQAVSRRCINGTELSPPQRAQVAGASDKVGHIFEDHAASEDPCCWRRPLRRPAAAFDTWHSSELSQSFAEGFDILSETQI